MPQTTDTSTHYTLSLAKKILITGVIFTFIGTIALKLGPLCSKVVAACTDEESLAFTNVEIAPQYFYYSDELLNQNLRNHKTIVLYFHAPWCTSCTSFDDELTKNSSTLPPDVVVLRVPFDTASELKKNYNVAYQHTLVLLDKEAKTKEMWIGGDLESLLKYLKRNS